LKQFIDDLESAEGVLFNLALSIEAKDPYTRTLRQTLEAFLLNLQPRWVFLKTRGAFFAGQVS
jgi:hypothetical protein